jgi:putative ABC transport system ATP-binding protein
LNQVNNSLLFIDNVYFRRNNLDILKKLTIKIEKKGITGIIGPSGAGKSTFLRLLNRLISPTNGNLYFKGQNYNILSPRKLRKEIGLVQQRAYLFNGTVKDNLLYGANIWDINYTEKEIKSLLEKVAFPTELLNRSIDNLSEGEKQRISLARCLANKPTIILMDEPTSALDINSEQIIEDTINKMATDGIKIILVSHNLSQTKRLTNQLLFLKNGSLIEKNSTKDFFKTHNEEEIRGFFKKKESNK